MTSRVGVVYLLGAFKTQGAIPMVQNAPLTLMQLAAVGGGPGFEGKYNDLRLIRTTGSTRTVVRVDLKKVIQGQEADPVLQPDDIVFLPTSNMKARDQGWRPRHASGSRQHSALCAPSLASHPRFVGQDLFHAQRTATMAGPPSRDHDMTTDKIKLAYLVSHPIQYQAPLLRRIAQEPDIDLTVFYGSDFSLRSYQMKASAST